MEEEGFFYFFEHSADKHTLVIADRNAAFPEIPQATLQLDEGRPTRIVGWTRPVGTALGSMKMKDYDPVKPASPLEQERPSLLQTSGIPQRDGFHWPALTFETDMVKDRAQWVMEAAEAAVSLFEGGSRFGPLVAGGKFTIKTTSSPGPDDGEYVVRSITHHAISDTPMNQGGASYSNSFSTFPAKVKWRQPRTVPRPRMDGIHSAIVLGPQGEEIYTDSDGLGRVKVRFRWDHRAEATADMSMWARVIQPWAGNGWGTLFLPRVGSEVAVAFVDGDPDRPIVVGGLYNGNDKPIYTLPDEKTKSGLRTRSTTNGSTSNFSEFTIDDKKGHELVFLHAEKDHTVEVENDQKVTIGSNQTVEISNNRNVTIDTGNDSLTLSQGDRSTKLSMGNMTVELSMGNLSTKADLGQISENAMQSITMTVGENSITIDQTGITISGLMVKIQGQVMAQTEAPMIQLSGDGMVTVNGGIVMIN
jgi:type VI secretion system secreted protein VgrG